MQRRWREALLAAGALLMSTLMMAMPAGCAAHPSPSASAGALSYLALGDSYTIGEGVAPQSRWPVQLAHALRADGVALGDPHIIAATGWTTDELSAALDAAHLRDNWDFVSLMIGVNNQYRGRNVDDYRSQFAALLERALGLAGRRSNRVLVLGIPDWSVTRFGRESGQDTTAVAARIDAYNAAAREICAARGVAFVDITQVSRERGAQPAMLADDGLHPSAAMHALWTQLALPVARRQLAP